MGVSEFGSKLTAYSGSMNGSLTETMSMSWCSTLHAVSLLRSLD